MSNGGGHSGVGTGAAAERSRTGSARSGLPLWAVEVDDEKVSKLHASQTVVQALQTCRTRPFHCRAVDDLLGNVERDATFWVPASPHPSGNGDK